MRYALDNRSKLPGWSSQELPAGRSEQSAATSLPAVSAAAAFGTSVLGASATPTAPVTASAAAADQTGPSDLPGPSGQSRVPGQDGPSGGLGVSPRRELRALFALRRTDSSGGVLQPRLAPWPIAKRVLEALNPLRSTPSSDTLKVI